MLDPWQGLFLDLSLAEQPSGQWEAFESGLIVPRQNGKGGDIEAIELGGLFLLGEQILHTAQLMATSRSAFRRLLELITNTDWLRKRVKQVRHSADDFSIELKSGAKCEFAPRSARSGRGESKDRIIYDEAMFLGTVELAAQVPTMSTRKNPQLNYFSSAGVERSEQLRALRARAVAGGAGLVYAEWSVDATDADGRQMDVEELEAAGVLDDEALWAQSNPALGIRISLDYVRGERRALPSAEFARERLGVFDEPAIAGREISKTAWEALEDLGSRPVGAAVFGIDVTPERDAAAIVVAGQRIDGVPHVEAVAARSGAIPADDEAAEAGLAWVVEFFAARRGAVVALAANGPAGGLAGRLEGLGITVVRVSDAELARAAQGLADAVVAGQLRHLGDPVLGDAVAAGRRKDIGDGAWSWSRANSSSNIAPLVGMTLALHELNRGAGELVYPGFDLAQHVVDVEFGPEWQRIWAVRLGFLRPFVWQCWALTPDGVLVLEHELYRTHCSPQEMAAAVRALGLPRAEVLLCDGEKEERRSFERALGRSAREPLGDLADSIAATSRRLAEGRLVFDRSALVQIDPELAAASRPTCTTDEFPGYVWDAEKEIPCDDSPGLECARWVVARVDLRSRGSVRFV